MLQSIISLQGLGRGEGDVDVSCANKFYCGANKFYIIGEAGGDPATIYDQDDTSLTPIPVGTPSKSQQSTK